MNGYFQLEIKDEAIYLQIIPPTEGGEYCKINDIISYLEFHNITGYNTVKIKRFLQSDRKVEVLLTASTVPVSGEELVVQISDDKMTAWAKFYAPFVGGRNMDKDNIKGALMAQGVTSGIKEEAIDGFLNKREYCVPILIAEGVAPEQGRDASIEYFFETNLMAKPQLNDDGSVDFHKLNGISHVAKDSILATLTPEVRGKAGCDVMGNVIAARDVKKLKLSIGKNMSYSKDRLSVVSDVDGHASLIDGKIFVSNTYEVAADVDSSTGDIEYNGNIMVKGNVRGGFSLKADGDIMINGVVEGATVIAEGDIIVGRGIQGMGRGILKAKGNVVTKFIENATVKAGMNITTEAILHSTVMAGDSILVTGRKGFVTGGKVSAYARIEAKTIGSAMGAETAISVGIDPEEKEMTQQYQKDMAQLQKDISRLEPAVKRAISMLKSGAKTPPDKLKQINTLVGQYRTFKKEYDEKEKTLYDMFEKEKLCKDPRICVNSKIYPGVKIVISECMYIVKETMQYCQFRKEGADVKMIGL